MSSFQFAAPPMHNRVILAGGDSWKDFNPGRPARFEGPAAVASNIWDPKLRCKASLTSRGFWAENTTRGIPRADGRELYLQKAIGAVNRSTVGMGGSPTRAVPAVYAATQQANNYGGRSTF